MFAHSAKHALLRMLVMSVTRKSRKQYVYLQRTTLEYVETVSTTMP